MKNIRIRCPGCNAKMERFFSSDAPPKGYTCGRCGTGVPLRGAAGAQALERGSIEACLVCNNPYFFVEKDFPRPLAFGIVGIGAALTPFTYGLSLLACGAVDFFLYQVLPMRRVCYLCKAQYRGFPPDPALEAYDPHKGVAYDARQAVPKI